MKLTRNNFQILRRKSRDMLIILFNELTCGSKYNWVWLLWSVFFKVARCTKIINADTDDAKYVINVKQFAKFVVDLGDQVAPTDIEEGMRVGYEQLQCYL